MRVTHAVHKVLSVPRSLDFLMITYPFPREHASEWRSHHPSARWVLSPLGRGSEASESVALIRKRCRTCCHREVRGYHSGVEGDTHVGLLFVRNFLLKLSRDNVLMQDAVARDRLLERTLELDNGQFEQLCKMLIERAEQTRDVELTTFTSTPESPETTRVREPMDRVQRAARPPTRQLTRPRPVLPTAVQRHRAGESR